MTKRRQKATREITAARLKKQERNAKRHSRYKDMPPVMLSGDDDIERLVKLPMPVGVTFVVPAETNDETPPALKTDEPPSEFFVRKHKGAL